MATDLTVLLTQTSTSTQLRISDDDFIRVFPISSGTGANVLYNAEGARVAAEVVDETAAKVAGMSKQLIPITNDGGTTEHISARRIITMGPRPDGVAGTQIEYDAEGAIPIYVKCTETASAIQLLINAKAAALPSSDAIIALNRTTNVFNVAPNLTAVYTAGTTIQVVGSTGNDGIYNVVGSAFGANTAITVTETISDATADGTIIVVNTV